MGHLIKCDLQKVHGKPCNICCTLLYSLYFYTLRYTMTLIMAFYRLIKMFWENIFWFCIFLSDIKCRSIVSSASVQWPFGTYTLVKPKSGCPPGWLEGWRRQDNENSVNRNCISYGHHFFGISIPPFQFVSKDL